MRIQKGRPYAVLTGDIVGSTKLAPADRRKLPRTLESIGKDLAKWNAVPLPLSRYRGDAWQLLASKPEQSLRVALFVRAALRARFEIRRLDTRIAIGVGTVDFVPGSRIAEGDGEAYRRSGAALEDKGGSRLRFSAGRDRPDVDVVLGLVDYAAQEWTPAQAAAVCGSLLGQTQERIAAKWSGGAITQQAVAQHLRRAGWDPVESAVRWFEEHLKPERL